MQGAKRAMRAGARPSASLLGFLGQLFLNTHLPSPQTQVAFLSVQCAAYGVC